MSLYSHSRHINQSVSVHSSAASRVMCSSSLHPQQDTSTFSLAFLSASRRFRRLKCRRISVIVIVFFMLFLISLTEKSIAESAKKSTNNLTFFHFIKESFFCNREGLARFYFEKRYFLPFKSRKSLKLKDLRAGGGGGRKSLVLNGLGYRKRPAETK